MLAQLAGATAAAAVLAGPALAESPSREQGSSSRPGAAQRDTIGAHAIDPLGPHHRDANPLDRMQHANAMRDYLARAYPDQQRREATPGGETATWSRTRSADGTGWAVCRPQAAWC
ncbi:hypothetical protein Ntsu_36730 [Nocardia sp. IFM 10818]